MPHDRARHVVIIGGSVAGMSSAIALSQQGLRVTLIERDGNPRPESLADAASWERKGAPQFHHPHVPGLGQDLGKLSLNSDDQRLG